jgi:hypothetical protein
LQGQGKDTLRALQIRDPAAAKKLKMTQNPGGSANRASELRCTSPDVESGRSQKNGRKPESVLPEAKREARRPDVRGAGSPPDVSSPASRGTGAE